MRFSIFLAFFMCSTLTLHAQLQEAIISHNPQVAKAAIEKPFNKASARSQQGAALPFFDDFAYEGPFPDANNWVDNHVFINNTLANQPISIGVATFDGLDAAGGPYGGGFGSADTLTSISLDLSGNGAKYLSYYIQPKGLGDAPGPEDRLILEFKNTNEEWIEVQSHEVTVNENAFPLDSLPTFQFIGPIIIEDAEYLHENFQFRFRNLATRTGAADLWHIDYVRLEETEMTENNNDLALTTLPSDILRDYASVPWLHLSDVIGDNEEFLLINYDVDLYNFSNSNVDVTDSEFTVVASDGSDAIPFKELDLLNRDFGIEQENVPSGFNTFTNPIRGEYFAFFDNEFKTANRVKITVDYRFNADENELASNNNQASRVFDLANYYAYDDGSAESAYFVGTGGQVAVKFTNYKADLLQAIRLQSPRIVGGNITGTNFTLKVWLDDLNSEPVYEAPLTKPLFIDEFVDSLQAFTTYILKDPITDESAPIDLPVGDFYIGWQQVTPCGNVTCFPVGFDRNTPSATNTISVNIDGAWREIGEFFDGGEVPVSQMGAMMIRPVVGSETPNDSESVSTTELALPQLMNIYPNPTTGAVNIQLFEGNYQDYQINIFNTLGQQIVQQELQNQLDLSTQTDGIYFLQFIHKETLATGNHKLILKR